ncbi:uncharacterized protein LOC131217467 [Magnolia sinica]|uniref:uncharacterized protein LOC131217467 n=1 Tax=Magnolia sinica TaxID=86752 RepID=UPI002657DB6B|nr:uncharacterized protein LOC131217467 [Magnolia sinica]
MKGLMRFGQKGKLAPHFIGPFEILDRVGAVAYRLALPTTLASIHNVFHISMLKKYTPDDSHIISWEQIELTDDASYTEEPIRILDHKKQVLQTKTIPLVKVLWSHHGEEEATWEREVKVKEKYPHLFSNTPQDIGTEEVAEEPEATEAEEEAYNEEPYQEAAAYFGLNQ